MISIVLMYVAKLSSTTRWIIEIVVDLTIIFILYEVSKGIFKLLDFLSHK